MSKLVKNPFFQVAVLISILFTLLFLLAPRHVEAADGFHGPAWMAKRPQGLVVVTAADGTYTWTFGAAYLGGVTPVVVATPTTAVVGDIFNIKITAVSNTMASILVSRTTDTTVLGIHLLGIQAAGVTTVSLFAIEP